jgi:putative endonuclease
MYFVYIVACADETLYIGSTNNIEKRIKEHNTSKRGARYTSTRRPVQLVYTETYETITEAMRREYELKTWTRKQKLDLIESEACYTL